MKKFNHFPNIWGAILMLICLLILEVFISNVFFSIGFVFDNGDPSSYVIPIIANGIIFSFFMYLSNIKYIELFHPSSNSVRSTILLSILPILIVVASSYWWLGDIEYFLISLYPKDEASIKMLNRLMGDGFITIITLCIIAPILEELLFRGIILRGFLIHYSPINAILASSALFSLMHFNVYQIPGAFLYGCFFGWLFYISKSVWPSMLAHSLSNAGAYIFYLQTSDTYLKNSNIEYSDGITYIFTFLLSISSIYIINKIFTARS